MAKSIVTMLAQIAIQKGLLESWHQKVSQIIPAIRGRYATELELWHLSAMASGMTWEEDYDDPFGVTAQAYYGDDVSRLILSLPIDRKPGAEYDYQSGSTQLLGMVLIQATGMPLSELASDWLWRPMQAERNATWHVDAKGTELAFCCFNATARDFARFGKLLLHQGNWNGTPILDSSFVRTATAGAMAPDYGYSFWVHDVDDTPAFSQEGILGQYIITVPEHDLVIVRLGHRAQLRSSAGSSESLRAVIMEEAVKAIE